LTEPTPFGVYVHVPFCRHRCDYCAFATWTDRHHLVDDYVAACRAHAREVLAGGPPASSVFFGGGTPSLLTPGQIDLVLSAVPRTAEAEVTVECNPETVDAGLLAGYAAAGVNRLSFGVQSMSEEVLAGLGRRHDPESVHRAVGAAAGGGGGAPAATTSTSSSAGPARRRTPGRRRSSRSWTSIPRPPM
jgi:oxygen-independent coproporphyrinogen-3 oxidase